MAKLLTLVGLGLLLALAGCGPLITYGLCQHEVLDCRTTAEKLAQPPHEGSK